MWNHAESQTKPKTRKELFDAIWKYRRSLLAYRYGVSEYLLLKVCTSFDIPYPSTNIPPQNRKPALKGRTGALISWDWKDLPIGRIIPPEDKILLEAKQFSKIHVPRTVKTISPFVKELQERHWNSGWGHVSEQGVMVTHSSETQHRAEAIMETLIRAIKKAGGTIGADPKRFYPEEYAHRAVGFFGDFHTISIREPCKRIKKKDIWYSSYDYEPRGILTLQIETYEWEFQKSFTESKSNKLEERIPEILESLFLSGLLFQRTRQEGIWRNMREEARQKKARQQIQDKRGFYSKTNPSELLRQFARWKREKEMRVFLKEIIQRAVQRKMDIQSIQNFKKWYLGAKLYIDQLNPLDAILDSFEEKQRNKSGNGKEEKIPS